MTRIAPSYYSSFTCIADRCQHNCCIGWEIDIDPDTAAFYETVGGELGERLRSHIDRSHESVCFRLTDEDRCPFLNGNGLCDIICHLSETALCDICAEHPRFYHLYSDREEVGLGLCCEEAARLILSTTQPVSLDILDGQAPVSPTTEEAAFFGFRDRLLQIAQDRRFTVASRESQLLAAVERPHLFSEQDFHRLYAPLERLDPSWDDTLAALLQPPVVTSLPEEPFEQLLCYFLYRHLADGLHDDSLPERTAFAVHSTRLIRMLCERSADRSAIYDIARAYSAEIEYSDENVERLLTAFYAASSN